MYSGVQMQGLFPRETAPSVDATSHFSLSVEKVGLLLGKVMVCILTKSMIVPPTAPGNGHNIAECCNYDFPKWKWIFGCNGELKSWTTLDEILK